MSTKEEILKQISSLDRTLERSNNEKTLLTYQQRRNKLVGQLQRACDHIHLGHHGGFATMVCLNYGKMIREIPNSKDRTLSLADFINLRDLNLLAQ